MLLQTWSKNLNWLEMNMIMIITIAAKLHRSPVTYFHLKGRKVLFEHVVGPARSPDAKSRSAACENVHHSWASNVCTSGTYLCTSHLVSFTLRNSYKYEGTLSETYLHHFPLAIKLILPWLTLQQRTFIVQFASRIIFTL